jgi:hypothetical protein
MLTDEEIAANRERLAKKIEAATTAVVLPSCTSPGQNGQAGKEIVRIMPRGKANQDKLFEVAEMNVPPPLSPVNRKYVPLTQAILSASINGDGRSEWMRFLFASRRAAGGAVTHLGKKQRPVWREEGHDVETALIPADDDKCWLYVRRIRTIDKPQPAAGASAEQAK